MTDQELKKLKRVELLELLVEQAAEMEVLQNQLRETQAALESRQLMLAEAGSIAEAALGLNQVFSAADQAARDYLDNVQAQRETLLEETRAQCRELVEKTRAQCAKILEEARRQAGPSGEDEA